MKNIVKTILAIILFIASVIIQIFIFNDFNLFGVKPNMILISIIVVSMFTNIYACSFFAFLIGFVSDLLFGTNGLYTISYSIIGMMLGYVSDNYMKGNVLSAVILTVGSVTFFEIIEYISTMIVAKSFISLFSLFGNIIMGILINVIIVVVLSFIVEKIIGLIDKKQDKIYW